MAEIFPGAGQAQVYGMTETGPTGTICSPSSPSRSQLLRSADAALRYEIVDEAGRVLEPNEVGEICIRSPANMLGYYKNPEATVAALKGGWMHTGDIGRKDAGGFLYYLDRLKDVINRGGLKISSMEVEDTLYRHPAVLEAAVVAAPHPQLGEDIRAFVALCPEMRAEPDELRAHCAASSRLTRYRAISASSTFCPATAWARSRANFASSADASVRFRAERRL